MRENKLKDGCILLARVIEESSIWRDDPHLLKLFIYLILNARHNKKPKRYPGFEVNRGELITSLNSIAEANEWIERNAVRRWSRQQVSRMLAKLQKQERVSLIADTYGTHLKVCNYEAYQNLKTYKRTEPDSSVTVADSGVTVLDINNNDNNDITTTSPAEIYQTFISYWNSKERLPKIRYLTDKRRDALRVRMGEKQFAENWQQIIDRIDASDFACGGGPKGWRADIDWLIKNDTNYVKVLEDKYKNKSKSAIAPLVQGKDGLTPRERKLQGKKDDCSKL